MAGVRKRVVIGMLLFATGFIIGWQGAKVLRATDPAPEVAALAEPGDGPLTRAAVDAMVAILVVEAVIHRLRSR